MKINIIISMKSAQQTDLSTKLRNNGPKFSKISQKWNVWSTKIFPLFSTKFYSTKMVTRNVH